MMKEYKLPNRKRKLLTKEFLQDFKKEIIKIIENQDKRHGKQGLDYENETYYGFYGDIEGTYLFYNALETTCRKYNLIKSIYEYAKNMPWYYSDAFDDCLVLEMVNKEIILESTEKDFIDFEEEDYFKAKCKLIQRHKGYNVVKYECWMEDNRESLEEIYKNSDWELIWLS